jgi:periplasmic protein TonB
MRTLTAVAAALTMALSGCALPEHPDTRIDCRIVQPAYPATSRAHGEAGVAAVKFSADEDGHITSVTITKSSGYAGLDEAALSAMRRSTCKPLYKGGKRVPFTFTQPFEFSVLPGSPGLTQ